MESSFTIIPESELLNAAPRTSTLETSLYHGLVTLGGGRLVVLADGGPIRGEHDICISGEKEAYSALVRSGVAEPNIAASIYAPGTPGPAYLFEAHRSKVWPSPSTIEIRYEELLNYHQSVIDFQPKDEEGKTIISTTEAKIARMTLSILQGFDARRTQMPTRNL